MPVIATVNTNDGETVPVNHPFAPTFAQKGSARWENAVGPTPLHTEVLTMEDNRLSTKSQIDTVTWRLYIPTVKTDADGKDYVAYYHERIVTDHFPKEGTVQERKNISAMAVNMAVSTNVAAVVQNRESIY